jgi:putative flippase GtrA
MAMLQRLRSLFRFGVVGIINNSAAYLLFLALIWVGVAPVVASGVCYCMAIGAGYLANRYWSFDARSAHATDSPRYLAAYGIGLVFALVLISILTNWMSPAVAQLICIGLTALVVFGSLVILRFGENTRHAD